MCIFIFLYAVIPQWEIAVVLQMMSNPHIFQCATSLFPHLPNGVYWTITEEAKKDRPIYLSYRLRHGEQTVHTLPTIPSHYLAATGKNPKQGRRELSIYDQKIDSLFPQLVFDTVLEMNMERMLLEPVELDSPISPFTYPLTFFSGRRNNNENGSIISGSLNSMNLNSINTSNLSELMGDTMADENDKFVFRSFILISLFIFSLLQQFFSQSRHQQ